LWTWSGKFSLASGSGVRGPLTDRYQGNPVNVLEVIRDKLPVFPLPASLTRWIGFQVPANGRIPEVIEKEKEPFLFDLQVFGKETLHCP
jgi:hypothetical protein